MKKRFGKIENGVFVTAPNSLKDDKFSYFNPKDEKYIEFGYQEIISDKYPEDKTKRYKAKYEQKEGFILETWEEITETPVKTSVEDKIKELENQLALLKQQI
jgi:hypothetical protein